LADVLIQETVRHDIGESFPDISENIQGEESNKFTNTLGESITVRVQSDVQATSDLLEKVLDGNTKAAQLLAQAVHSPISEVSEAARKNVAAIPDLDLETSQCGIWIDPIDSTANYIEGGERGQIHQIHPVGLQVVTVLLGVYSKHTGEPILGVVNQPFHNKTGEHWQGNIHWGVAYMGHRHHSFPPPHRSRSRPLAILSHTEGRDLVSLLEPHYDIVHASGAGHKLLMVAMGLADVYVTAKASTYKWDSCGPDALLNSLGGRSLVYRGGSPILYNEGEKGGSANLGGIVAYRDEEELERVRNILKF